MYKETLKRKADNKYKTPFEPIQSNIDKMEEVQLKMQIDGDSAYREIRRSLLNEDEYGFRKAKRPIYYDEGLEVTWQNLNKKISQLNSAIDNVSSRLRGRNNMPPVPVETDPEEATM
ncbi:hypothetical protein LIER_14719 [Lithospermum erythrorhizon]|uniref:Uncharacterized protein n=1 Tax=Lithospermum erythrorhizon TaxID=34254 RepID=A0AAV3Q060_LITER